MRPSGFLEAEVWALLRPKSDFHDDPLLGRGREVTSSSTRCRSASRSVVVTTGLDGVVLTLVLKLGKMVPLKKSSSAVVMEKLVLENSKSDEEDDDVSMEDLVISCLMACCASTKSLENEILGLEDIKWL